MDQDQQRLTPGERANLVAYLDGELPEGEARVIAAKLTRSATARREVESLEKTWGLLDHLPRPAPATDLTERTVSLVRKLDAAGGRFETSLRMAGRRCVRAASWTAAACLGFVIGFMVTRWAWPNPTDRLSRELSLAEHFEEYRDVGDFSFLKMLVDSPEFGDENEDRY